MVGRAVALTLSVGTFLLLLLGGIVHSIGASLACPDWPLCYGQVFPEMKGGLLYEHGHRLLASGMGLLTLALAVIVFRQAATRRLRRPALLGVVLVASQGLLGGLTVIYRLPPAISIAHLGTAMAFFAWGLWMNFQLAYPPKFGGSAPLPPIDPASRRAQRTVAVAAGLAYVQLLMGAMVRHHGASMSCGYDVVGCAGALLPASGLQWLQTSHRLLAILLLGAVGWGTRGALRQARAQKRADLRALSIGSHALVTLQILLGILVIKTTVQTHVVTTHLGLGALLWGDLVLLYLALGRPVARPALGTDLSSSSSQHSGVAPAFDPASIAAVGGQHGAC
jgi:heme A synthase